MNIVIIRRILQILTIVAIFVMIGIRVWKFEGVQRTHQKIEIENSPVFKNKVAKSKVVEVFDGDTVLLEAGEIVRYLGIDTPEIAHPPKSAECFGDEAREQNKKLVLGREVLLEADQTNVDRYGRLLRHVYVEGVHINRLLAEGGFAFALVYPPDELHNSEISTSEKLAKSQKLGLWKKCDLSKRGRM